jgi:hypothetical protein
MKKPSTSCRLLLCTLGLGAALETHAALVPVAVTGYNADVVANGTGAATASTTDDVDGGAVNNRFNLMAPNFVSPTGATPTSFLPATGLINSVAMPGLSFQLAPYTANNSLRINGVGTGTLAFPTPQAATDVYLLAMSGNGASAFTATVTFADGSTQAFASLSAPDWFGGTSNVVISGLGRVNRDNNTIQNSTTDPRLYQIRLTLLAANASKQIRNVLISKAATTGTLNIMGVSINNTVSSTLSSAPPIVLQAFPNPATASLTVRIPAASAAGAVQLLDLAGRVLQAVPVRNQTARFDLQDLAAGLYLARYQDGERTRTVKIEKH